MSKKVSSASEIDVDKFAQDLVDSWDMDTLIGFAVDKQAEFYRACPPDQLVEEYNEFHGNE